MTHIISCNKYMQVKADLDPEVDPETLKEETAEWIAAHKGANGEIKK